MSALPGFANRGCRSRPAQTSPFVATAAMVDLLRARGLRICPVAMVVIRPVPVVCHHEGEIVSAGHVNGEACARRVPGHPSAVEPLGAVDKDLEDDRPIPPDFVVDADHTGYRRACCAEREADP